MNLKVLKAAEKKFLKEYPGGFNDEKMEKIRKKHKVDSVVSFAQEQFEKKNFAYPNRIVEDLAKLMTKASVVAVFEKMAFKNMLKAMTNKDKEELSYAVSELLHGMQKEGFELLVAFLKRKKMAKWTIITTILSYYSPKKEVFVKPTTTKLIIQKLDLDLEYKPTPTWEFYKKYRTYINKMKKEVDKSLSPNSPAFSGFLMMSL